MKLNRHLIRKIQAKYPHDEVDSEGSWAISYGDMITLLLTFFIIFFSIKPEDRKPASTNVDGMTMALMKALQTDRKVNVEITSTTLSDVEDVLPNQQYTSGDLTAVSEKILKDIKGKVHLKNREILIEFPNVSFFNSAKIDVTAKGELALIDFAKVFLPYMGHFNVGIRAYTDNRKVRQDSNERFKDNLELSALRGVAAMRVLQRSGLPLEKIKVGGYGELRETARILASATDVENAKESINSLSLSRKIVLVIEPNDIAKKILGGTNDN